MSLCRIYAKWRNSTGGPCSEAILTITSGRYKLTSKQKRRPWNRAAVTGCIGSELRAQMIAKAGTARCLTGTFVMLFVSMLESTPAAHQHDEVRESFVQLLHQHAC